MAALDKMKTAHFYCNNAIITSLLVYIGLHPCVFINVCWFGHITIRVALALTVWVSFWFFYILCRYIRLTSYKRPYVVLHYVTLLQIKPEYKKKKKIHCANI